LDPVDQISISNYAVMGNSPIWMNDPLGDYSKFGAWWRNKLHGGNGIKYTNRTGEWGYEIGEKDGSIAFKDGHKAKQYQEWLENEQSANWEDKVFGDDMLHKRQYYHQDAPEGVDPNAPMDFHDRVKEAVGMTSLGMIAVAPRLNVTRAATETPTAPTTVVTEVDLSANIVNDIGQTGTAILKNGYYEVNGFKFSEYYYSRLWATGRKAPSLIAREVLQGGASKAIPDVIKPGFNRYEFGGWEMIYNPSTKEVWHLQPIK
jgi:hypothetical protein